MRSKVLFLLVCLIWVTGCQPASQGLIHDDDVILVEVDGAPVSLPMLEYLLRQRGIGEADHEGMRSLLEELIRLRAVANAAEREGLADTAEMRAQRLLRDLEALQIAYFTWIHEQYPVAEEDIREVYDSQLARSGSHQYRFETLLFASQSQALLAIAAVEDGELAFADLATSERFVSLGQDWTGWVDRSQLGGEIPALLADLEAGSVLASPLQTEQGWRVLRLHEVRPLEVPALDQVREGIARQLVRQRLEAAVEDLYEAARITPMLPLESARTE